jgi:hypothetical protein
VNITFRKILGFSVRGLIWSGVGGTLLVLEGFMGAMALVCGLILTTGQSDRLLGMQRGILDGTPFSSFLIPGAILALAVGGSQLAAAWVNARDINGAAAMSVVAGCVLLGWISGEIILLGWIAPRVLQPFCFWFGVLEVALSVRWVRGNRCPARNAEPHAAGERKSGRHRTRCLRCAATDDQHRFVQSQGRSLPPGHE